MSIGDYNLRILEHPNINEMIMPLKTMIIKGVQRTRKCIRTSHSTLYPEVANIKDHMKLFGADAVLMSGSGPTVFGLVEHDSRCSGFIMAYEVFVTKYMQCEYWASQNTLNKYVH